MALVHWDFFREIESMQREMNRLFDGDDIVCEVPIMPDEAALGAKINLPTPDGSVTMTVPAGVQSGQSLRLRGKSWSRPKGGRSDQIVKLKIVLPKRSSVMQNASVMKSSAQPAVLIPVLR